MVPVVQSSPTNEPQAVAAAETLAKHLEAVQLPLPTPTGRAGTDGAQAAAQQLRDHVIPRLRDKGAPLLAVVGGSTGAGKSTLVNSLLRDNASPAGVLRPTTRMPVLCYHPDDEHWFVGDRVLPRLTRVRGTAPAKDEQSAHSSLRLTPTTACPQHIGLLDAPDVDSVVDANRSLAKQLLDAADLWIFCTSAARYADAVPWSHLRQAAERGTSVCVVLGRVPPNSVADVREHLRQMMDEAGLTQASLFAIEESALSAEGLLPAAAVGHVHAWIEDIAGDEDRRRKMMLSTLRGAIGATVAATLNAAAAVQEQSAATARLNESIEIAAEEAVNVMRQSLQDGTILRGEVLARWHEFLGTSPWFQRLETRIGRMRDRVTAALTGRPYKAETVREAVLTGVTALVADACEQAAENVRQRWERSSEGDFILAASPRLHSVGDDAQATVQTMIRQWQGAVIDLVREEAAGRRTQARLVAVGVNVVAVALMIVVFAGTAFIPTGAEIATAAGSAAVGQRILEAIFGEDAVRRLAAAAREDLEERAALLVGKELQPFITALANHQAAGPSSSELRDAAVRLEAASSA